MATDGPMPILLIVRRTLLNKRMDFDSLSFNEKCNYLWLHGEFMASRELCQQKKVLYWLDDQFVELTLAMYEDFEIKFVEPISEDQAIAFYWQHLPLPD